MSFQPEITKGDPLYELIVQLVVEYKPKSILEIGSGNGLGSTQAFIEGVEVSKTTDTCKIFCIEAHPERFIELKKNTNSFDIINCIYSHNL